MKINKGFSLLELVISMLIVSIAMLGFASLLAFSTRTITTNFAKNAGTELMQSAVNILSQNKKTLAYRTSEKSVPNVQTVPNIINSSENCEIKFGEKISDDRLEQLKLSLQDICNKAKDIPETMKSAMAISISYTKKLNVFDSYIIKVNVAYQTKKNTVAGTKEAEQETVKTEEDLINNYCPLTENANIPGENSKNLDTLRINDSVACNTVEVQL